MRARNPARRSDLFGSAAAACLERESAVHVLAGDRAPAVAAAAAAGTADRTPGQAHLARARVPAGAPRGTGRRAIYDVPVPLHAVLGSLATDRARPHLTRPGAGCAAAVV